MPLMVNLEDNQADLLCKNGPIPIFQILTIIPQALFMAKFIPKSLTHRQVQMRLITTTTNFRVLSLFQKWKSKILPPPFKMLNLKSKKSKDLKRNLSRKRKNYKRRRLKTCQNLNKNLQMILVKIWRKIIKMRKKKGHSQWRSLCIIQKDIPLQ